MHELGKTIGPVVEPGYDAAVASGNAQITGNPFPPGPEVIEVDIFHRVGTPIGRESGRGWIGPRALQECEKQAARDNKFNSNPTLIPAGQLGPGSPAQIVQDIFFCLPL